MLKLMYSFWISTIVLRVIMMMVLMMTTTMMMIMMTIMRVIFLIFLFLRLDNKKSGKPLTSSTSRVSRKIISNSHLFLFLDSKDFIKINIVCLAEQKLHEVWDNTM